jgi:hypothetical protein
MRWRRPGRHHAPVPFELPEYERAFAEFLHFIVQEVARAGHPVLSQIEVEKQTTTTASRIRSREGVDVDLPQRLVGFEVTTSLEAVRSADYDGFAVDVHKYAEELREDLAAGFYENISTITEATGNVVDAGGELTFGKLYELMEKMEWNLNDDGELSIPSMIMHPSMVEKLRALETPETLAAMEELIARKYEEALARRPRRRLS